MKSRFGPTLVRRVFFAVLLVYPLLWIGLLADNFLDESRHVAEVIPEFVEYDSIMLERYTNAGEAAAFMYSSMRKYGGYQDKPPYYIEVWSRDEKRIFFNEKHVYPYPPLTGDPQHIIPVVIDGINYVIRRRDGELWSLRVVQPVISLQDVIKRDATDLSLDLGMLLALPVLMLPIWWAVKRGLRPLQVLSDRLAMRDAQDLAPLGFDAGYRELKPTVAALESLLQRLREKVRREQNFVHDAAHELHTPMAVISAHAHVLAKAETPSEKEAAERHIDHAIARASHLIRQLLELARVDGLRAQDDQMQDLAQLVRADLAQIIPAALLRDMDVSLDAPETLLFCLERSTFQSILHNLLDNAIRYGHVGGVVEVVLKTDGERLLLTVADNGPGIVRAEQERVFERFYRGAGQETSGTGLGLAIVRQAVARLAGTVHISAGIGGKGCCFTVWIPAQKQQVELTSTASTAE